MADRDAMVESIGPGEGESWVWTVPRVVWDSVGGLCTPYPDVVDCVADAPSWPECPEVPTDVQRAVGDHLESLRALSWGALWTVIRDGDSEVRHRALREAERRLELGPHLGPVLDDEQVEVLQRLRTYESWEVCRVARRIIERTVGRGRRTFH